MSFFFNEGKPVNLYYSLWFPQRPRYCLQFLWALFLWGGTTPNIYIYAYFWFKCCIRIYIYNTYSLSPSLSPSPCLSIVSFNLFSFAMFHQNRETISVWSVFLSPFLSGYWNQRVKIYSLGITSESDLKTCGVHRLGKAWWFYMHWWRIDTSTCTEFRLMSDLYRNI